MAFFATSDTTKCLMDGLMQRDYRSGTGSNAILREHIEGSLMSRLLPGLLPTAISLRRTRVDEGSPFASKSCTPSHTAIKDMHIFMLRVTKPNARFISSTIWSDWRSQCR